MKRQHQSLVSWGDDDGPKPFGPAPSHAWCVTTITMPAAEDDVGAFAEFEHVAPRWQLALLNAQRDWTLEQVADWCEKEKAAIAARAGERDRIDRSRGEAALALWTQISDEIAERRYFLSMRELGLLFGRQTRARRLKAERRNSRRRTERPETFEERHIRWAKEAEAGLKAAAIAKREGKEVSGVRKGITKGRALLGICSA